MMLSMVLATTLLCSLAFCTAIPIPFTPPPGAPPAQNAADAWNQFFLETEHVEYPYDYDFEWTDEAQTLYEELSPVFQQARAISTIEYCDWGLDYSKGLDFLSRTCPNSEERRLYFNFQCMETSKTATSHPQWNTWTQCSVSPSTKTRLH